MTHDVSALLEREKDVLRLLLVGHDAKSIARHLDLSTYVVNERLRDARRKLGVGSSREAARLLALAEADGPKNFGDKDFGYPKPSEAVTDVKAQVGQTLAQTGINKGILVMIVSATLLASAAFLFSMNSPAPAGSAATVVSTYPVNGSQIKPGPYKLTVRFDRPMAPDSFSFVQVDRATYPECSGKPEQSTDGKSYTLNCIARAGKRHEVWFNRKPYMNFRSKADAQSATPYRLRFSVKP
jgi:DNA-binding CsgD family transcriptional regulator/methionine-rich copper-binding protein CopC